MDDEGEDVPRVPWRGMSRIDARKIGGFLSLRRSLQPIGPQVQRFRLIGGLHVVRTGLKAGVDEVGREVGDLGIGAVTGIDDRGPVFAGQGSEGLEYGAG